MLVAFSGGPDSTALLHRLAGLRQKEPGLKVEAAHFDHGLSRHSAFVAERCARTCAELEIPFHSGRPADPLPVRHAALRRARYEFLSLTARRIGADRIATAHHADDQAETVLLRLDRGTGVRGLAGIPRRRGPIVRPLLGERRSRILAWLADRAIPFESDPANEDLRWARSRVRHVLLPALGQALGRDPVPLLLEIAKAAGEAERWLSLAGERLLAAAYPVRNPLDAQYPSDCRETHALEAWQSASGIERAEALRVWARRRGLYLSTGGTRAAEEFIMHGRSGGRVLPTRGLRISRSFDSLILETTEAGRPGAATERLELHREGGHALTTVGGRAFRVRWTTSAGSEPVSTATGSERSGPDATGNTGRVALTVGPEHYPLVLRSREPGDRVATSGGTRKLKKLFGERKVPVSERGRIPVLADRTGRVIWVSGLAIAEWARPAPDGADLLIEIENA